MWMLKGVSLEETLHLSQVHDMIAPAMPFNTLILGYEMGI